MGVGGLTSVAVLQGLVLLRHLEEHLLQGGVHHPEAGQGQAVQALLQRLQGGTDGRRTGYTTTRVLLTVDLSLAEWLLLIIQSRVQTRTLCRT